MNLQAIYATREYSIFSPCVVTEKPQDGGQVKRSTIARESMQRIAHNSALVPFV